MLRSHQKELALATASRESQLVMEGTEALDVPGHNVVLVAMASRGTREGVSAVASESLR